MVFTHDIFPSFDLAAAVQRQDRSQQRGTRTPNRLAPLWRKSSASSSSSSATEQPGSPASLGRTSSSASSCSDAVALVLIKEHPIKVFKLSRRKQQHSIQEASITIATPDHAPSKSASKKIKRKLKAAAMFLAEGLSWSAHSRAALPVPLCPSLIV